MTLSAGSAIGILGGGQLGRMLAGAAAKLGFDVHIYCPGPGTPAARAATSHWDFAYEDRDALAKFARACDVVTVEFENVPVDAARAVEAAGTPFRPGPKALEVAQDRVAEKTYFDAIGIAVAPWRAIGSLADLRAGVAEIGPDTILKTRREGYDGKGQVRLRPGTDLAGAWAAVGEQPSILEAVVDFELEVSAIVARRPDGARVSWEPSRNVHSGGILRSARVPAPIEPATRMRAVEAGVHLAESLEYVGVLALELFVMPDGTLLANEFAPRVHNSGHWTPEACHTGQFENHIRAIAGWPLGAATRFHDAEMINLIGEDALADPAELADGVSLTLYGKREARAGRKMGHVVKVLQPGAGRS